MFNFNKCFAFKYEILSKLGEGSYGAVYKCRNKETDDIVAIKHFLEKDNQALIRKVAKREIQTLKALKHPNLISLIEIFRMNKRYHLVFEFCESTILAILETHPKGLPEYLTKSIIWQVLNGISFCHYHNYIHRDIKPENILITKRGIIKICDFGLARKLSKEELYTDYVATRWYRAPELLLGVTNYGKAIDIWSIGCVFAELITGTPLWPGNSDLDQLHLIMETLGALSSHYLQSFISNEKLLKTFLPDRREAEPLTAKMKGKLRMKGMDFLRKCLEKNSKLRSTAYELLKHSYWSEMQLSRSFWEEYRTYLNAFFIVKPKSIGLVLPEIKKQHACFTLSNYSFATNKLTSNLVTFPILQ